jgi:hypothetical protein
MSESYIGHEHISASDGRIYGKTSRHSVKAQLYACFSGNFQRMVKDRNNIVRKNVVCTICNAIWSTD